ncbi:MAG: adenylate/guanylate cyclase domain-containing protein [Bradyrhizobium sp.]|uniref:adenylate/guanylate cyclase domain-containing protein n=1 Tax=Bradyrhizobium sp. TaxID=376 RepID=UPI0025C0AF8D|nr:adenylate/guanylate cyclase domain-containing protein [Bradyrhizobium sp.]MBI5263597.1 adenylate/guanylate cyclase domain-containing protein [Bradyrhizobium sp.]
MRRITRRNVVAALLIALVSGASLASIELLQGLSLDLLTTLRWELFGDRRYPASSPVVVVAIDEETYHTAPFVGSPTMTWSRELGRVVSAIADGGARVIGFDVIFPTSIEQSEIPFGDQPLGARLRGFDRDFLRSLRSAASAGKLVLGEILSREHPERPSPGQRLAALPQNIRALNVNTDPDEVIRRLPLTFLIDGKRVPSMAVELAARALDAKPELSSNGEMTLGGYRIPGAMPNTMTLNFRGGGRDIPTYSFADLHACLEKADNEFFRREFGGKVVILGTVLNFEDRKLTSIRLSKGLDGARAPRCVFPAVTAAAQTARSSMAGVFVHATAVKNLMGRDAAVEPGFPTRAVITVAIAAFAAFAACLLAPLGATLVYIGVIVMYTAAAVSVFVKSLALPVFEPTFAGAAALAMMVGYRFVIADKEERFLRKSFAFYLAPQVIDTMLASAKMPALGGEMRNLTVFFSDVAGFSSISEKLTPTELVALMNEYLSAMTDIIENHGGYIDKYIGDSIVAVFGAPVDDPDHARNAVRAALQCRHRLEELNTDSAAFQGYRLAHRIGLNSGGALVGNIGSKRRFNYTVMSDAVNVASRLEGANKYFGTSIMASEMTVAQTGGTFAWRELDAIRVKGRAEPVNVYEPLAEAGQESEQQSRTAAAYAEGLAHWRAREFERATACFDRIAGEDPPSAIFSRRAKELATHPPPPDWEPVNTLEGK